MTHLRPSGFDGQASNELTNMKDLNKVRKNLRIRRKVRTRAKVLGTAKRPRLAVFRSLKHLYVQAIDDEKGQTLVSADNYQVKAKTTGEGAEAVGRLIAKKLLEKKITAAVFDRRYYKYHGLIKAVAEGAREGGLKF